MMVMMVMMGDFFRSVQQESGVKQGI